MYNEDLLVDAREGSSWLFENYNKGTNSTNKKGHFGYIECWFNKEGIANIFSITKLEEMVLRITYYRQDGRYILHTKYGGVQSNKDVMGIPYTDSKTIPGKWPLYKPPRKFLKGLPRKRSPQPKFLTKPRE